MRSNYTLSASIREEITREIISRNNRTLYIWDFVSIFIMTNLAYQNISNCGEKSCLGHSSAVEHVINIHVDRLDKIYTSENNQNFHCRDWFKSGPGQTTRLDQRVPSEGNYLWVHHSQDEAGLSAANLKCNHLWILKVFRIWQKLARNNPPTKPKFQEETFFPL